MKRASHVAAALMFATLPLAAKVSQEEADKLKTTLTPMGAERGANADGTIPAWEGGLTTAPPCYKGKKHRYCDPFPDDKPLFTITAQNYKEHADKLSAGQKAMFEQYPGTYKMKVYPTRRTAGYADFVYEATYKNALNAELISEGEGLSNASVSVPFPIPKSGKEPVWNHKVRFRGVGTTRWNVQAAVTTGGDYNLVKITEDIKFHYNNPEVGPDEIDNVLIYFLQIVRDPARLAGTITLVHETMDQVTEPRRAWQYNPGQRRLRRAPNVGYDNPGTAADGLRTNDQLDLFNGATDRYTWKIVGKKEVYIPYNSYDMSGEKYKYSDILQKGHINPELPRYELHRVWVVEGEVKPTTSHIYAKRRFYIDEDSWQIALVDIYDRRGALWRWQEGHSLQAYAEPFYSPAMGTVYDLQSGRYLALEFSNEEPEAYVKDFPIQYFDPSNVQKQATK
ncbi:DUF1329 domain-containing protein [Sinimarinibacterium flocculans]|uniref:Uncharacterized protein DUF1329 n=1 Tax=Sinimarinibacterium flocculans TaxID=985250 RepID=A0A318E2I9_9GAMM|nr:DUF1329 domain-containing protein [Sinimarinibacterium flocculans]PXV65255.1 uncharacterized protein DUF1329 [Sinimarinibacterium flocculans]